MALLIIVISFVFYNLLLLELLKVEITIKFEKKSIKKNPKNSRIN